MTLTLWDPFGTLARFDRDADRFVRRSVSNFAPRIEIAEQGDDVLLTLELPGLDVEKDVNVEVSQGRLIVSGQREERSESDGKLRVRELRYGSFRREFTLPEGIGAENIEASYDRGLLEIRVKNAARPAVESHKVEIRTKSDREALEAA